MTSCAQVSRLKNQLFSLLRSHLWYLRQLHPPRDPEFSLIPVGMLGEFELQEMPFRKSQQLQSLLSFLSKENVQSPVWKEAIFRVHPVMACGCDSRAEMSSWGPHDLVLFSVLVRSEVKCFE